MELLSHVSSALVLWRDEPGGLLYKQVVADRYPGARVHTFDTGASAVAFLDTSPVQLAVVGTETEDSDGLDYIPRIIESGCAESIRRWSQKWWRRLARCGGVTMTRWLRP